MGWDSKVIWIHYEVDMVMRIRLPKCLATIMGTIQISVKSMQHFIPTLAGK